MRIVCRIFGIVSLTLFVGSFLRIMMMRPDRFFSYLLESLLSFPVIWLMVFAIMCVVYVLVDIRDKLNSGT